MDRPQYGRARAIALGLLWLNVIVLAAGLTLEHWRSQPRTLVGYNADKVRLLPSVDAAPASSRMLKSTGRPTDVATASSAESESEGAAALASEGTQLEGQGGVPGPVCVRVTLRTADDYSALRQAMAQAGVGGLALRTEPRLGWWVYWPPLDDPVRQVQALAAIEQAGVRDIAPIRQGPMARAISLGMFASEADARRHLEDLQRKGLTELRHGPRPGVRAVYLDIPAAMRGNLRALRTALPAGLSLAEVACAS